ncbi:MAG: glutamate--cysteine ligase [Alphaproteobacteria bacterium]|jgi:glutamate--cysteine ligase
MLTHQDLLSYFYDGIKKPDACKMGLELEQFSFNKATGKPLPYDGDISVSALLHKMIDDYGWQAYRENDIIIALKRELSTGEMQNLSLEPGGQIELSGAVHSTVSSVKQEAYEFCYELYKAGDALGIGFKAIGFTPEWTRDDFYTMPKQRYNIMKNYMPQVGTMGLDMMFRTCTVQLNMDYISEADMVKKVRVALALQPLATAYFANSSIKEGQDTGFKSYRSHIWTNTDKDRTGILPFMFNANAGFEVYMEYALAVPMYFVKRDGRYIDCAGQSFADFMQGKLPALPNIYPTLSDWEDHLSTIFPEVRLKNFIEMRGADANPLEKSVMITDFWSHLIYNPEILSVCTDIIKNWDASQIQQLRLDAARFGFDAKTPDNHTLSDVLKNLFTGTQIFQD